MVRSLGFYAALLAVATVVAAPAAAQPADTIENELVLITPVAKTLTDPALAEFAKYAKEKWNITVKTSALAAGTPVAYGQIVEWKGRPGADIFWGGESALFDKLADQKLLAKLDLPQGVVDAIPASIGKPKPIPLKDPKGFWIGTVLEPYGLVYQPESSATPRRPCAEGLGRPAQSEAQGQRRAMRADALEQQPRDLRGDPAARRRRQGLGVAEASRRQYRHIHRAQPRRAVGRRQGRVRRRLRGAELHGVRGSPGRLRHQVCRAEDGVDHARSPSPILAGAPHPKAARAFIEYMLSERGQRVAMERGVFPITPKFRVQGAPGSTRRDGRRIHRRACAPISTSTSTNIYDDDIAQKRYEAGELAVPQGNRVRRGRAQEEILNVDAGGRLHAHRRSEISPRDSGPWRW